MKKKQSVTNEKANFLYCQRDAEIKVKQKAFQTDENLYIVWREE